MKDSNANSTKLLSVIIGLFAFGIYANSIPNGYNLDDNLVTQNHRLTKDGISAIPEILTSPYYEDDLGYAYEYRPIVLISFAIEHSIFGEKPRISHFINVLLYTISILLLFRTLLLILPNAPPLFVAAIVLLFTAHPSHTEVVASIKNRDEILAFGFAIASLYYSFIWLSSKKISHLVLVVLLFSLAILSKKSILAFSLIIPIALVLFSEISLKSLYLIALPIITIGILFTPLPVLSQKVLVALAELSLVLLLFVVKNPKTIKMEITAERKKRIFPSTISDSSISSSAYSNLSTILILCSLPLGLLGIFTNSQFISISAILLVSIPIILTKFKKSDIPIIIMSTTTALMGFVYGNEIVVQIALIAFLFYGWGILKLKLYSLILVLVPPILSLSFLRESFDLAILGYILVFMVLLLFRKRRIAIGISVFFLIAEMFGKLQVQIDLGLLPLLILTLITIFEPFIKKNLIISKLSVGVIPLILLVNILSFNGHYHDWKWKNQSLQQTTSPQVLPAPTGRSLDFIETPINHETNLSKKLGTSFYVLGKYTQLLLLPHPLSFYYGYQKIPVVEWFDLFSIVSLIFHLLIGVFGIYLFKRMPILSFGLFIYLFSISIFSNLLAPVAGLMADRYLYSASLGFCLILTCGIFKLFKVDVSTPNLKINSLPKGLVLTVFLILISYSGKTIIRNTQWKDKLTLFKHDIKHLKESAQANNLLATEFVNHGLKQNNPEARFKTLKSAQTHYTTAVEIHDEFFNAWYDLGRTSTMIKDYRKAILAFQKVIELDPNFSDAYFQIALILQEENEMKKAIEFYNQTIEIEPTKTVAYTNLSLIYFNQGLFDKAIEVNKSALDVIPNAYDPLVNIGKTYYNTKQLDSALIYFEKAYTINSQDPSLVNVIKELKVN